MRRGGREDRLLLFSKLFIGKQYRRSDLWAEKVRPTWAPLVRCSSVRSSRSVLALVKLLDIWTMQTSST